MKRGDLVKVKADWVRRLIFSYLPDFQKYYMQRHKVESLHPSDTRQGAFTATFNYPKRLANKVGEGQWRINVEHLELVRSCKPKKCKWGNCGKIHDEDVEVVVIPGTTGART